jgi:O-succinylbenzoate synthase
MTIDRIELFQVAMPLISPWRTAYGEDATIQSVLVKMVSGDETGWGETSPLAAPCYSPEWAGGVFAVLRDWLAPAVIGQEIDSAESLGRRLAVFKGNSFAKAALDTAWWTLDSRRRGVPLYRALGGTRNVVEVGADFGVMDSLDELIQAVGTAVDSGFKRVKLKFRPGWDLPMLQAVRGNFPKLTMHIDCNSGYRLDDLAIFREIDRFGLAMIEQPLAHDDLVDHAKLSKAIETPVCLDESITSLDRARQAIELGSCRWVNIKPGRVGGLTTARAIHDMCRDAGIPCWVGGMLESAVGASLCIALAALDNFRYPADIFPSSRFYHEDLADPPIELDRAAGTPQVRANDNPGIQSHPVAERLDRCCLQRAVIADSFGRVGNAPRA